MKVVPVKKNTKRWQKAYYAKQRNLWSISPVTRKVESRKAYQRHQKHRKEDFVE